MEQVEPVWLRLAGSSQPAKSVLGPDTVPEISPAALVDSAGHWIHKEARGLEVLHAH